MKERDYQIILHIRKHCEDIVEFSKKCDYEIFCRDNLFFNAITMSLLQIGELAKNFSDEFISESKEIPWRNIKGLRDVVAHGYNSLDKEIIWNIAENEINKLNEYCCKKIQEYVE